MCDEIWKPVTGRAEGFPYEVSNKGKVRRAKGGASTYKGKILKQSYDKGYPQVTLSSNGKQKTFRVHWLVADAFLPPPPGPVGNKNNEWQIDHEDNNPKNNSVNNLQWMTTQDNKNKAFVNSDLFYSDIFIELVWILYYQEGFASGEISDMLPRIKRKYVSEIIGGHTKRRVTKKLGNPNPRGPGSVPNKGSDHGRTNLDEMDILFIRAWGKTGKYTYQELADEFAIHKSNIGRIIRRETWKHIPPSP